MTTKPQIYVASLSDYNAGRICGKWLDAAQDPEDIAAEVSDMLAHSPTPGAEEWAIHDHQGFGPLQVGEWEPFEWVSAIAKAIECHGPEVVGAYVNNLGPAYVDLDSLVDDIDNAYQGAWDSVADYAESLAEDIGAIPHNLTWPLTCIDWQKAGMDLVYGGDIWVHEEGSTVYVFDAM